MIKKVSVSALLVLLIQPIYSQTEITLEEYFRTLRSIEVEIEGKTYDFLFDTGGGLTLISPSIAEEMNKAAYGNFVGFRMNGERFESEICDSVNIEIGGRTYTHPYVGVFDLMALLPDEFKRVDGLISLKTFEDEKISLNLKEDKLIVETDKSYRKKIRNMNLVKSRFASGTSGMELNIFTGILHLNRYWWFLFDTGNIAKAKVSEITANEWGIHTEKTSDLSEIGEYAFLIGGDSVAAPTVVDRIIYDGALSYDFISQSEYTISFEDEVIWKSAAETTENILKP